MKFPRSPYDKVQGLVYFGRLMDKIRLFSAGELHPDLQANLGIGFDKRCCNFLGVSYEDLKVRVLAGGTDDDLLEWCFANGQRRNEEEIEVWNGFMTKRGWNDEASELLERRKKESGFSDRPSIRTMFQYIDADEGRGCGEMT